MTNVRNGLYYAEPVGERARLKEFQQVVAERAARYAILTADPAKLHREVMERIQKRLDERKT